VKNRAALLIRLAAVQVQGLGFDYSLKIFQRAFTKPVVYCGTARRTGSIGDRKIKQSRQVQPITEEEQPVTQVGGFWVGATTPGKV
jgi:hypothetical protein